MAYNDIDRLFMTWTLIHGVLKKHKNAESFNNKKNEIQIFTHDEIITKLSEINYII